MLANIAPGQTLTRRDVHALYGGRQQGGIGPSRTAPVVLFFTDPATGHRHGYYDGWDAEGLYNYCGEGQLGDQRLVQGNKAILKHAEEGRTLEGFRAKGSDVTYLGEFALVDYYWTEAHESGSETLRQVVVFRLRPVNGQVPVQLPKVPITVSDAPSVSNVSVEEQHTERAYVAPNREPYELERREASLVLRYRDHLKSQGHAISRLRAVPAGEVVPLYSDLWDETTRELVEAKGGVTRELVRSAVGQLLDYGRFVDAATKAVLLPSRPRSDLVAFLESAGVHLIYPDGDSWMRI